MTYHLIFYTSNTAGAKRVKQKLLTVQVHLYWPVAFSRIRVSQSLVSYLVCCVPLFVFVFFYIVCPSILKTGQNKYLKNLNILGFNSTYLIKLHLTPFKTYQKSLLFFFGKGNTHFPAYYKIRQPFWTITQKS